MTLKLITFTSATCVSVLFIPSLLFPNDPYFDLLISTNLAVMIFRLILVAAMVGLVLKPKARFKYRAAHKILVAVGCLLAGFALLGMVDQNVDYELFAIFKPMDYLFSLTSAVFMFVAYFEFAKGRKPLPKLALNLSLPAWNLRRTIATRWQLSRSLKSAQNL